MNAVIDPLDDEFADFLPEPDEQPEVALTETQQLQAIVNQLRDPTLHEVQDPRHARIIEELTAMAHTNLDEVFETSTVMEYAGEDDNGDVILEPRSRLTVADIKSLPERVRKAVKKIKIKRLPTGDIIEVEMYDKNVSIEKLMRHYGMYEQDNAQRSDSIQDRLIDLMFDAAETKGMPVPVRELDGPE